MTETYITDEIFKKMTDLDTEFSQLITERDTLLSKLKQSEYKFKVLSNSGNEGIAVCRDGVLIATNKCFQDMLGYTEEELARDNLMYRVLHPDYREEVVRRIETGDLSSYKCVYKHKMGYYFPVHVKPKEVEFNGKGICRAAIVTLWKEQGSL